MNLKIDENMRNVLGAVTNDANQTIVSVLVNPITGALLCEADVTSVNTQISSTIPGGTAGSVLFLGPGSTLAEDNTNFFYNDTTNRLGLGTNTPQATLHIVGDFRYVDGNQHANYILGSDASGTASWFDISSNAVIMQSIAVSNTFITALVNNNTFTTNLANNSNFITNLTSNSSFITNIQSVAPDNFSYEVIDTGVTVTVPLYQQMIVQGGPTVLGTLNLLGTLVVI